MLIFKIFLFTFLLLLGLTLAVGWRDRQRPAGSVDLKDRMNLKIGQTVIKVDLAKTPLQRERGLSGRSQLGVEEGLLFVFDQPGFYPFWMKGMNFPIDIVWIGSDFRIVDVSADLFPNSFPQTFTSKFPAQYVLEVARGFVQRHSIKPGGAVDFVP